MAESKPERLSKVGLCCVCRHSRAILTANDSEFWLCQRNQVDPRFAKYPALPRRACEGFEQHDPTAL